MSDQSRRRAAGRATIRFAAAVCSLSLVATTLVPIAEAATSTERRAGVRSSSVVPNNANRTRNDCRYTRGSPDRYFVEFRARSALSYGHSFVVMGMLGPNGQIARSEVIGLHPATDDPSVWMAGHALFVQSETGPSDGDTEEQYVTARYCVRLSEAAYRDLRSKVEQLKRDNPTWHAIFNNCNKFIGSIGSFIGLSSPFSVTAFPADFVNGMKQMNSQQARF